MSLFHNLKLKRRKVDSRSSSDGSESAAAAEIISKPPSLASASSEISMEDSRDNNRPNSHGHPTAFEVEVKKFEMTAPRYTNWASPAKLKQEPFFTTEETTTLTPATVVPKIFTNGSSDSATPSHLPKGLTLVAPVSAAAENHRPRLAEALRPPPNGPVSMGMPMVTMSSAAHLPFAAAAAAAKLQAMQHHSNLVTSSAHPNVGQASPMPSPVHLHAPPGLQHPLRMTGQPQLPSSPKLLSSPVKTESQKNGSNNQNR